MRPCLPAILRIPGRLGLRLALVGGRRFFGLRSLLAVSSVASGRIEFVSQCLVHRSSTDYLFTSSCSPPRVATAQLLSVTRREAPPVRDLHPLCTLTLKRTSADFQSAVPRTFSRPARDERALRKLTLVDRGEALQLGDRRQRRLKSLRDGYVLVVSIFSIIFRSFFSAIF